MGLGRMFHKCSYVQRFGFPFKEDLMTGIAIGGNRGRRKLPTAGVWGENSVQSNKDYIKWKNDTWVSTRGEFITVQFLVFHNPNKIFIMISNMSHYIHFHFI